MGNKTTRCKNGRDSVKQARSLETFLVLLPLSEMAGWIQLNHTDNPFPKQTLNGGMVTEQSIVPGRDFKIFGTLFKGIVVQLYGIDGGGVTWDCHLRAMMPVPAPISK